MLYGVTYGSHKPNVYLCRPRSGPFVVERVPPPSPPELVPVADLPTPPGFSEGESPISATEMVDFTKKKYELTRRNGGFH